MAFDLTSSGLRCGSNLAVKFIPGSNTSSDQLTFYWGTEKVVIPAMSTSNTPNYTHTPSHGSYTQGETYNGADEYSATCTNTYQIPNMSVGGCYIIIGKIKNDTGYTLYTRLGDAIDIGGAFRLPSTGKYIMYSSGTSKSPVTSYSGKTITRTKSSFDYTPFDFSSETTSGGTTFGWYIRASNSTGSISNGTYMYNAHFIYRLS